VLVSKDNIEIGAKTIYGYVVSKQEELGVSSENQSLHI
jgi:hypothetical protein